MTKKHLRNVIGFDNEDLRPTNHQYWSEFEPGGDKEYEVEAIRTSTPGLRFAHGQANNPVPCKAKTRTTDRTRYEARQRRRQGRGNKEEATRRSPSQCSSRVRSRRVAGDLSPWRREYCQGACMIVDYGSLTPEELHSTLF